MFRYEEIELRKRQNLIQLHHDRDSWMEEGEDNTTIKYINGIPSILKRVQKK